MMLLRLRLRLLHSVRTFRVVLDAHVVEVVEGVLQDPDAHHVVLARRGQQAAAVGELHGPDGPLMGQHTEVRYHGYSSILSLRVSSLLV